ncbi:hypothetical protein ACFOQM_01395 [Paenibacillus sp. GCM10012307]|uniref:PglD N-terminal domain-containing protein n=1 Tax=Paenibacillus roseus TaxID=2798579 RepID=A0A934J448_9BACL|nr:hypothetical protein [Paenibacillus roseus]MBJ6359977.1 hypothetical protein [Paenibacillus roseus]
MKLAILGASGLAAETADLAWEVGYRELVFIDKEPVLGIRQHYGFNVVGEERVHTLHAGGFAFVIAIGDSDLRCQLFQRFPQLNYVNLIHPSATLAVRQEPDLLRRQGNLVFAGCRITTGIQNGNFGLYNLNCTVAHDCIVEDFVTIGPGANISGNVHLMERCSIGTGAVILQGRSTSDKLVIGSRAIIGAGAVVTRHVGAGLTVKGVPAR